MDENKKSTTTITILTIVFLVLFFPVGLLLMWLKTHWSKPVKLTVSALFSIILIGCIFALGRQSELTAQTENQPTITPVNTKAPLSATPTLTNKPIPTPTKLLVASPTQSLAKGLGSYSTVMNGLSTFLKVSQPDSSTWIGTNSDSGTTVHLSGYGDSQQSIKQIDVTFKMTSDEASTRLFATITKTLAANVSHGSQAVNSWIIDNVQKAATDDAQEEQIFDKVDYIVNYADITKTMNVSIRVQ